MEVTSSTKAAFFTFSLIAVVGCAKTDSENVRTSAIEADISIFAEDDTTAVSVFLSSVGGIGGDFISLSRGDLLTATLRESTITLSRSEKRYLGAFTAPEDDSMITVSLTRDSGMDAANSTVTLPNDYIIETPNQSETFNTGDSITATWAPSEPEKFITIAYTFNCEPEENEGSSSDVMRSFFVPDTGTHTTTVSHILNVRGPRPIIRGVPCPVELEIFRTNLGELDSAFKNGRIDATRSKTVTVNFIP